GEGRMRVSHFSSTALEKPLTSMLSPPARREATAAMLHDYPKCHKNSGCDNPSIAVRALAPPTVILIPQGREKNLGSISTDSSGKTGDGLTLAACFGFRCSASLNMTGPVFQVASSEQVKRQRACPRPEKFSVS